MTKHGMLQKMAKSSFFRVPLVGTVLLEIDFFFFFLHRKKKVGLQWSICNLACWLPPTKFSFPSLLKLKCSIVSQLQQWTHLQQIPNSAGFEQIWGLSSYRYISYISYIGYIPICIISTLHLTQKCVFKAVWCLPALSCGVFEWKTCEVTFWPAKTHQNQTDWKCFPREKLWFHSDQNI